MDEQVLRGTLSSIAVAAVPETTDLWPAISRRLADRARPSRPGLDRRRIGLATTATLVLVVGLVLVGPSLIGPSGTARAADIARHDPAVAAALHGDIAAVTVTSVVDQMATVVVQDSTGQRVTVTVDLLHQIVTRVYQGPQLSAKLSAEAVTIVGADPRTRALMTRGATIDRTVPILVTVELASPPTGTPTLTTETWAQVFLELDGGEWVAYVDLPMGKIDRLLDPQANEVPLP